MEWSDREAAAEARLGNQRAFRALVERHSPAVFRLAYLMTRNEQDAEDVVQETFLKSFQQIRNYDAGRAAFGTWLHRIGVNCSLDVMRRRKVRREKMPDLGEGAEFDWWEQVRAEGPSPERLTESGQIAAMVKPALDALSATERTAFVLRHFEGCRTDEIAQVMGTGKSAAKQAVFRAVQKLRAALEPAWSLRTREAKR